MTLSSVPDGFLELHRSFKIHSKQFVYETLIGWGLNPEKMYSFKGGVPRGAEDGSVLLENCGVIGVSLLKYFSYGNI